jgi:SET and MYND domain-containing protein
VDSRVSEVIQSRIHLEPYLEPIFLLICQEESNSFGLYTFNYLGFHLPRQGFGLALYPSAVYFNHSCVPNVGHTFASDHSMEFFALQDLGVNQECSISYIQHTSNKQERQKILKELFYFECRCELCETNSTSLSYGSCKNEDCFGHIIPQDGMWNCVGCGQQNNC